MRVTWGEVLHEVVQPLLKDEFDVDNPARIQKHAPDHLRTWWNAGQARLSTMKPMQAKRIYKGDGVVVPLPECHYRPQAVYLAGREEALKRTTIEQQWLAPSHGYYLHDGNLVVTGVGNEASFLYSYYAYYKRVTDEASAIEVPEWAWEPCGIYVALQAVTREAIDTSRFNKFKSKTDSGNPEQNPFLPVLKWLENRFENIVKMHVDDDEDYAR